MEIIENDLKVKTSDGSELMVSHKIKEVSPYFESLDWESDDLTINLETTKETFLFLLKHLEVHDYKPCGVKNRSISSKLKANLEVKDYNYVKHLEGLKNLDKIAEYLKFCSKYDIPKLRQVYICLIATEFVSETAASTSVKDMNKHLTETRAGEYKLRKEFRDWHHIPMDRITHMEKLFPFLEDKSE